MAFFYPINLDEGSDFQTTIRIVTPEFVTMNLTGITVWGGMKESYISNTFISFQTAITDAANGQVAISLDRANTANLMPGNYVYDLKGKAQDNTVSRLVQGTLYIQRLNQS